MPTDFNAPCPDRPGVSIGEDLADKLLAKQFEVDRLVHLLGRLEWAGSDYMNDDGSGTPMCPACKHWRPAGHREDCWLAAELGRDPGRADPPEGSQP